MRKKAMTPGGKTLASDIQDFMEANLDEMKKSKAGADSDSKTGIEDIANAIAFAVEKALGQNFTPGVGLIASTYPVTGSAKLIGAKYVF